MEERKFRYCRPSVMNDHFDREDLQAMELAEEENSITRDHPQCKVDGGVLKLENLDHFRNHVQVVHGVQLRPGRK